MNFNRNLWCQVLQASPISDGVNLDITSGDKIVGIEILNASKKIDLKTILSYTLEFDKDLITQKTA